MARSLFLTGGGALGAWQAGALKVLAEAREFAGAAGFSAGSLNAAAWACGRLPEALEQWLIPHPMRLRPRLRPLSLFSDEPLRERLAGVLRPVQKPVVVISADPAGRCPVYARFAPGDDEGLREHLLASCAIPFVFPPVTIGGRRLVDGGVPLGCPLDLTGMLEGELVALCPVRPEEGVGWTPDERARRTMLAFVEQVKPALTLYPSRRLRFTMLTFNAGLLREAVELGERDARAFLNKL